MAPYCFGAATGSSKVPRRSFGEHMLPPPNEDRWTAHDVDDAGLYGVFDGHGGPGAAEFVANHLPVLVRAKLQGQRHEDIVPSVLVEAFLAADSALYQRVRSQQVSPKHCGGSSRCSRCRMYREKPCICTGVALPANVGSTGSLVHVTDSQITCASIGDSEVLLVSEPPHNEPRAAGATACAAAEISSYPSLKIPAAKRPRVESPGGSPSQVLLQTAAVPAPVATNAPVATRLTSWMLSKTDTPTTNEACEDFQRIKRIAEARTRTRSGQGSERYPQGVMCHSQSQRLNYVALSGAHRLNMTRAFGNFGHKEWRGRAALESISPIIARPHIRTHERTGRERFLVIGSDGLWDNVSAAEVTDILHQLTLDAPSRADSGSASVDREKVASGIAAAPVSDQHNEAGSPHSQWQAVAHRAAAAMLERALRVRKKPDDITCVVVVLT